ncbi:hypothetical protein BJ742DRAFT_852141 [Cladochytrium replicatum]|nr:hypothetical protein BJ742DRAFT_852141 [Cladochytrium replicatum]
MDFQQQETNFNKIYWSSPFHYPRAYDIFCPESGSSDDSYSELSLDNLIHDTISLSPQDLTSSFESGNSSPELRSTLNYGAPRSELFTLALPLAAIAPSPVDLSIDASPSPDPVSTVDQGSQVGDPSIQRDQSPTVDSYMADHVETEEDSDTDGDYVDQHEDDESLDEGSKAPPSPAKVSTESESQSTNSEPAFLQRRAKIKAIQKIAISNELTEDVPSSNPSSSRKVKHASPTPSTSSSSSSSSCTSDENESTRKRKKAVKDKSKSSKRARGTRPNFTTEQREWLTDWCRRFAKDPYPSEEEKEYIEMKLKLSRSQLDYWLTNARRGRVLRKIPGRHPEHEFIKK